MCGIYGFAIIGEDKKNPRILNSAKNAFCRLAVLNMDRGTHGSGVARISNSGEVALFKKAVPILDVVFGNRWQSICTPSDKNKIIIGHTRFATHGSKTDKNCHPFVFPNIVGAHNGVVGFERSNLEPDKNLEVDSAMMFELFQRNGNKNHKNILEKLSGSAAISFVYLDDPNKLYFAKSGNPLSIIYDKGNNVIYWSSDQKHLFSAVHSILDKKKSSLLDINNDDILCVDTTNGDLSWDKIKKETYAGSSSGFYNQGRYSCGSAFNANAKNTNNTKQKDKDANLNEKYTNLCKIEIGIIDRATGVIEYSIVEHSPASSEVNGSKNKENSGLVVYKKPDSVNIISDTDLDENTDGSGEIDFFSYIDSENNTGNSKEKIETEVLDGSQIIIDTKINTITLKYNISGDQFQSITLPIIKDERFIDLSTASGFVEFIQSSSSKFIMKHFDLAFPIDGKDLVKIAEKLCEEKMIIKTQPIVFDDGLGYSCDICTNGFEGNVTANYIEKSKETDIDKARLFQQTEDDILIVCCICKELISKYVELELKNKSEDSGYIDIDQNLKQ